MGSSTGKNLEREYPQHSVQIKPFFMSKFPITQAQWKAVASLPKVSIVLDKEPAKFKGENRPVECVSWNDAMEFCARLSRVTGKNYRLPSEAEWEYACRGGTMTDFCFGETITSQVANYDAEVSGGWFSWKKKTIQETLDVGSFGFANDFGLYDMHGNIWEWCADFWHDNYQEAPRDGRVWKIGGDEKFRVQRGGSWCSNLLMCRCAYRDRDLVDKKEDNLGFRVVC
jgi:formylglycine-generating enzyme required for sulfatase activity